MKIRHLISALAGASIAISVVGAALAATGYPKNKPREQEWSFAGPFGKWDKAQLQRGLQVYVEVCSACHGLEYVPFRSLDALGYSEEEIKAFAEGYTIADGPDGEGQMFDRPGRPSDYFPNPYANEAEAAYVNNGAAPPDLSNITKARAPERGFPQFLIDPFIMYAENGADYVYSLLTGYKDPPADVDVADTAYYNPYFANGVALAMAQPLYEDSVTYEDGSQQTVDQYAKDVSAFLMWTAEPHLVERKALGLNVMLFLLVFAALLYLVNKKIWTEYKQREQMS